MYVAHFSSGETQLATAALGWKAGTSLLPRSWRRQLGGEPRFDLALRITHEGKGARVTLLLSADAEAENELRASCQALVADKPAGLLVPANSAEFDALSACLPAWQIRVNHDGYHHRGMPLACDFRLYSSFVSDCRREPATYQVHLRAYQPDSEIERRVRKYLAWLELERPFSEPVRGMQKLLAQRLRHRGWLADEYLLFPESSGLERWLGKIREHFTETTGRIGFPEAPVETGDFTDWLVTGCHTARHTTEAPSLPTRGASVYTQEELEWLLSANFGVDSASAHASGANVGKPQVFISYASGDFAQAAAICRRLEESGVLCWIAPRDIDRDVLPYPEAIQRGLSRALAVVVVLSDTANLSVHIPRELDIALERKLAIIPIRLENVTPAGQLNYLLRTCQWLNAFGRAWEESMAELLGRLRRGVCSSAIADAAKVH